MRKTVNNTIAALNSLASGLKKNQPKGSFLLVGTKYTTAQLVTIIQSIVTALLAVPPTKAAYLKTTRSAGALQRQYRAVFRDLRQLLQLNTSDDMEVLADYGLTPRKLGGAGSPEVKVAAADKARATRTARHTMGPKERLQITGTTVALANAAASTAPAATSTPIVAALPSATSPVTLGH
jgi:hypothetical protein